MRRDVPVAGLLLAAGRAQRFGAAKLRVPLADGTPLGVAALRTLQHALGPAVTVVRADEQWLADAFRREGAMVAIAERADEGMGASLAAGVDAIAADSGIVVALADMPWIDSRTIAAVADAIARGALIAAPFHRGQRGHPVGFSPALREALRALTGDEGARAVIAAHANQLSRIDVDDAGILRDVDTPDQLAGR